MPVEIAGRKETVGRPLLYATTPEFLEVFGLKDLTELPTLKEVGPVQDGDNLAQPGLGWQLQQFARGDHAVLSGRLVGGFHQFVEIFAGNEPAGRAAFSPIVGVPEATIWLKLDKPVTLVVRDYCNLHGLWEGRRDLAFS